MYCIYRIINLINGKTYIGQHEYKTLDDNYMGSGVYLRRAQKKYGIENFKKEILVFNVSKKEHIDLLEKTFIAAEREKVGIENCYNITDGGEGRSGVCHSEETKEKMKKSWDYKKHITESWRKKQSEINRGRKMSEEAKRKMSEVQKGKPHPHKGSPRSEEAKRKLSTMKKGKHWKLINGKRVWY